MPANYFVTIAPWFAFAGKMVEKINEIYFENTCGKQGVWKQEIIATHK